MLLVGMRSASMTDVNKNEISMHGAHMSEINMNELSWRELCEAIMKETNPEQLMDLVDRLNLVLEQREVELRHMRQQPPRKLEPTPE